MKSITTILTAALLSTCLAMSAMAAPPTPPAPPSPPTGGGGGGTGGNGGGSGPGGGGPGGCGADSGVKAGGPAEVHITSLYSDNITTVVGGPYTANFAGVCGKVTVYGTGTLPTGGPQNGTIYLTITNPDDPYGQGPIVSGTYAYSAEYCPQDGNCGPTPPATGDQPGWVTVSYGPVQ